MTTNTHFTDDAQLGFESIKKPVKAVLFDLDGTLVDTAKDFVRIIHELATENNQPAPNDDVIRQTVSAGSKAMVSLFHPTITEKRVLELQQEFLRRYETDICVDSQIFEGLQGLLEQLENKGIAWGVVTNKPRYLSEKLLEKLSLTDRCAVLVCPEDVTHTKPNPEPLQLAMSRLNIAKSEADTVMYIGDHIRDIQAGNAAGNVTVIAGFGYISLEDRMQLENWNADLLVETPKQLVEMLTRIILT